MQLLDSTLREGEQTPGVNFSLDQKVTIAKMIDEIGIEMIEAGHPAVSPDVAQAVHILGKEGLNAEILAHVRAVRSDIDQAIAADVDRIVIFLATSEIHARDKLKLSRNDILDIITREVDYVRDHGIRVRYTPEDATRTDLDFLIHACQTAVDAGADRISIADTVGIANPSSFGRLIEQVDLEVDANIDVHCHNDLGLAMANAMVALDNGADCVHTTVNGLGERAGIVDTSTMISAMRLHYGIDRYNMELLTELSTYVAETSKQRLAYNQPIVGRNAFTHTSGVHTDGIIKNPDTYEPFNPSLLGRTRRLHIDRYAGKRAVSLRIQQLGLQITNSQLNDIIQKIKELGDKNIQITDQILSDLVIATRQESGSPFDSVTQTIRDEILWEH